MAGLGRVLGTVVGNGDCVLQAEKVDQEVVERKDSGGKISRICMGVKRTIASSNPIISAKVIP